MADIFVGGMGRNEETLYKGPYIDAFCQVRFHLAQLFQRSRLKYEKVNGRTTSDGNTFGSGELKKSMKTELCKKNNLS